LWIITRAKSNPSTMRDVLSVPLFILKANPSHFSALHPIIHLPIPPLHLVAVLSVTIIFSLHSKPNQTKNLINKMKTLRIGTKTQANKILLDSLFNPVNGKTLNKMKYCNGKYKPDSYIGREMEVGDNVHALFTESRKDSDGPYVSLMCITE